MLLPNGQNGQIEYIDDKNAKFDAVLDIYMQARKELGALVWGVGIYIEREQ